jgi:aminopeptidase
LDFHAKLNNYADLLICHGLNVQPGQIIQLTGEIIHRDFLLKLLSAAYRRGAKYVNVDFIDPFHIKQRIENSFSDEFLTYVPRFIPEKFNELLDSNGAVLRLVGSEDPDCLADLAPQKINQMQLCIRQSLKHYYQEGIGKSKVHWTVAGAATPKWGKKVFPELSEQEACQQLWEEIFKICRADQPNSLELWENHNAMLHKRGQKLTKMGIRELHFTGPGTDLKVYLSPKAVFKGGSDQSPRGVPFEPNIPTEENFTTPDCRLTEGKVRVTRPFFVNGKSIKGLELTFQKGVITHFSAVEGISTFEAYINSDAGGRRLGEVALVGIDSPVYQSGHVFQEILFDENAACHIAVGFAYHFCLDGGEKMSAAELEALGCNDSNVHTDMMISSQEVDVYALSYSGQQIQLIRQGKWSLDEMKSDSTL